MRRKPMTLLVQRGKLARAYQVPLEEYADAVIRRGRAARRMPTDEQIVQQHRSCVLAARTLGASVPAKAMKYHRPFIPGDV